ncbi:putative cysteine-rich receptor-like protein kinase 35 [Glycine soja]
MNPKISDFGLARMFEEQESTTTTSRIIGTYGYMSPEYAMEGIVSVKSDVYSFGVLVLEIISGRRNTSFNDDRPMNLIGHAWELWNQGVPLQLMDPSLNDLFDLNESRPFPMVQYTVQYTQGLILLQKLLDTPRHMYINQNHQTWQQQTPMQQRSLQLKVELLGYDQRFCNVKGVYYNSNRNLKP